MKENRAIIVSGYFDPIHQGHLDYLNFAAKHGHVFAIVNSDRQAQEKKGKAFQDEETRSSIVGSMRQVAGAWISKSEDHTVCNDIREITEYARDLGYKDVFFANGGDRSSNLRVPEADTCRFLGVAMLYDTSGKRDSSQRVLEEAGLFCERPWGWWRVLDDFPPTHKVKLLCVKPGKRLSYQRHHRRSEHWWVISGNGVAYVNGDELELSPEWTLGHKVQRTLWHTIKNTGQADLVILEVQSGTECIEEDIERQEDR